MQGSSKEAAIAEIGFPEANTLVFENLPSLVSFGLGENRAIIVKWPSLKDVTVNNCPKIEMSSLGHVDLSQLGPVHSDIMVNRLFKVSDKFSSEEKLDIDDAELSKILAMKLNPTHFTNVIRLQAKNCDERLNDFLLILRERPGLLEDLTIKECKLLKNVFVTEHDGEGYGQYFASLKKMILWDLPQLTCIWNKDPTGLLGLDHLETIEIMKCGSLKKIISPSAAGNLLKLRVLRLHSCEKIEEVVATEAQGPETQKRVIQFPLLEELEFMDLPNLIKFHRGSYTIEFPSLNYLRIKGCPQMMSFTNGFASGEKLSATDVRIFPKLSELELDTCGKLIYVIPSIMLPGFQSLKKLSVNNCDSLTEVIQLHVELDDGESMLPQLSELLLSHLPNLMHVISIEFERTKFFQNLQILRLKDCNSLKYLFLPFVASSPRLREIEISDCNDLERIFVTKGEETNGKILFSDVNSIALKSLPKLNTFSLSTFQFPSLKKLEVTNCPELKTFVSDFHELKDLPADSNNFFEKFESMEKVKELVIENQTGVQKLWSNKHPSQSIYELEVLTLNKSNNLLNVIASSMLITFNKLKNFTVGGCEQLTEVFDLEDLPDHDATEILPQLSEFTLICLPSLIHVWNKEPHVPVFQTLVSLQIINCDGLKKLFSISTAKHLEKLKLLKLYGCKGMEEVFEDEKGKIQENAEIVFPEVQCLILKHLPSLVSFCRRSCTFKWPKLRTVRMSEIPKMETFSQGNEITPLLRTVYVTFIKKCWQGDLNSTVQYLHNSAEFEMRKAKGEGTSGGA